MMSSDMPDASAHAAVAEGEGSAGVSADGGGVRSVVSVGVFDGVHQGHAAIVRKCRENANATDTANHNGAARPVSQTQEPRVVVIVLDPHPAGVLAPGREPARLTTFAQRERLLIKVGADAVVRMEPTAELLAMTPEAFVAKIVETFSPVAWVEGRDFRFGKGRAGDVEMLGRLGAAMAAEGGAGAGFTTRVVEPTEAVLTDHSIVPCRSTMARWLIEHGRVRDAAAVLGNFYTISATVVRGDRRGRTIGCPTANLACEQMLPADGVYAGVARLEDGRAFAAAVSVGTKPTFSDGVGRTLEAHLLGAKLDAAGPNISGLAEYGWKMDLSLISYLRDQIKYDSLDALKAQIARDCERTARIVGERRPFGASV